MEPTLWGLKVHNGPTHFEEKKEPLNRLAMITFGYFCTALQYHLELPGIHNLGQRVC